MRWLAVLMLATSAPGAIAAGPVNPEDVILDAAYFGSSSASLTWDGFQLLRRVAAAMEADPAMRLEVEGHSDTSASAAINVPLSQQREERFHGVSSRRNCTRRFQERFSRVLLSLTGRVSP